MHSRIFSAQVTGRMFYNTTRGKVSYSLPPEAETTVDPNATTTISPEEATTTGAEQISTLEEGPAEAETSAPPVSRSYLIV